MPGSNAAKLNDVQIVQDIFIYMTVSVGVTVAGASPKFFNVKNKGVFNCNAKTLYRGEWEFANIEDKFKLKP